MNLMRIILATVFLLAASVGVAQNDAESVDDDNVVETIGQQEQGFSSRKSRTGYTDDLPPFGGRNSPTGEIVESDTEVDPAFRFPKIDALMQPWTDWKTRTNDDHAVSFSAHYSTLYQQLSSSLPDTDDKASSGVLRGTLKWTPVGKDTKNQGSLNIMLDYRDAYRDTAPANLAGSAGYVGQTGVFYTDINFAVINLNWQQGFNDGNTGLIVGRFDPNDYQNVLGYVNPWTIFSNLAVNLDVSVALPDSSWGVGAGHWFNDRVYVIGGVNDANGLGSDDLEFFDGGAEFYKYVSVGWSPSKNERYFKNIHLLAWDVDERKDAGIPSSNGFALAANWTFNDRWMPFARLGFSKGAAPIYNETMTLGMIRKFMYRSDLVGIAANWGASPNDSLSNQTSIEAFWRFQFSQSLAITPSVQVLLDPSLNAQDDEVWVLGLRMRLAF
ncbi:MAG: carbohydrate porin [Woeseiaceae bacterium]